MAIATCVVVCASSITLSTNAQAADTGYYWKWTDGSRSDHRVFSEADFRATSALPGLLVTSRPAAPGTAVRLEFRQGGSWTTESTGRIGSDGTVRLAVNPLCEAQHWCDETLDYRLRAGGQTASFSVDYRAVQAPTSGNPFA